MYKCNSHYAEIASDFVASAYIPYLFFVLSRARVQGISKLYFLSRDGYILMKIAESLQPIFPEIEIKYLFVSRKSLILPSISQMDEQIFLQNIEQNTLIGKSVNSILRFLSIDRGELTNKYNLEFNFNTISTKEQERIILNILFHSQFSVELQKMALTAKTLFVDYLKQEGLCGSERCAAVDVGWLGTSRAMINGILEQGGYSKVHFYYYGIRKDCYPLSFGEYSSFNRPIAIPAGAFGIIEHYYSMSPYNTTIGYRENSAKKIEPIFANNNVSINQEVLSANILSSQFIAHSIMEQIHIVDFSVAMMVWNNYYLGCLCNLRTTIPLNPFVESGQMNDQLSKKSEKSFVRQLSISETVSYLSGGMVTVFDKASFEYSFGRNISKLSIVHILMRRVREKLYHATKRYRDEK